MSHFFTFGVDHPYAKKFVEIALDDANEARECMNATHGKHWSMHYNDEKFAGQPERHGLTRLSLIATNEYGFWRAA